MNENIFTTIPPDIVADLEEVARQAAMGGVRDPELLRRIRERSAQAKEALRREHGERNIAADLIRDSRDEE